VSVVADDDTPGGLQLPKPPGVIRRYLAAHPVAADAFLAGLYLIPTVIVGLVLAHESPGWQSVTLLVLSGIAGAALFVRRQHPTALFAIAAILLGSSVFIGREVDLLPLLFALYALAVYLTVGSAWIGFGIASGITVTAVAIQSILAQAKLLPPIQAEALWSAFLVLSMSAVAVLIGSNVGNRRRYLDALIDRAQQLARERDQQAEIATAAERSRIAREMHDIVSHSLTVMITLADGSARIEGTAPERSADTMRLVADTGRGALADMRRLLGVLRDDGADGAAREPQPGISELGELVETFRAAGLPVRITVAGTPPSDVGQQLTIFRVVQEGLTNVLRYASSATSVAVTIAFRADTVVVRVDDDATLHDAPAQGSGRGLIGLRERVGLYGGTLEAGPRPGGGWRVRASFDALPAASSVAPSTAPPAQPPPAPAPASASPPEEIP
jgi:signal transduction histidine kinase